MEKIIHSLQSLVSSQMINKAAATLGETEGKVSSAVSLLIPSLLARVLKEGATPQIESIVRNAGEDNLLGSLDDIFAGHGILDDQNYGVQFENAVVGTGNPHFYSAIASKSGLSADNANRLTTWVAALITGFFGKKMVNDNVSMETIIGELKKEKPALGSAIPANLYEKLGITSLFPAAPKTTEHKVSVTPAKAKKNNNNWIWWLIIIVLLLTLFFWMRSCHKKKEVIARATTTQTVNTTPSQNAVNTSARNMSEFTLPDGAKVMACDGSCEDHLITYLKSDEFKKATDAELRNKWFAFDGIDFVHDSSSELTPGSQTQLDNLATILKGYPEVKIRIGGFADKTGPDYANEEIAKERAAYIKSVFERSGIRADRVSVEGFSNDYAQYPVNAPDSLRAKDRDIALRLTR